MNVNLSVQENSLYTISITSSKFVVPSPPEKEAKPETPLQEDELESVTSTLDPAASEPQPSVQHLTTMVEAMREEFTLQLLRKEEDLANLRHELSLQVKDLSRHHDGLFSIVVLCILIQIARIIFFL